MHKYGSASLFCEKARYGVVLGLPWMLASWCAIWYLRAPCVITGVCSPHSHQRTSVAPSSADQKQKNILNRIFAVTLLCDLGVSTTISYFFSPKGFNLYLVGDSQAYYRCLLQRDSPCFCASLIPHSHPLPLPPSPPPPHTHQACCLRLYTVM